MKLKHRALTLLLSVAVLLAFTPVTAFASSGTVKMTGYDQVIKKGNIAYCAGTGGIYKVTLKKDKVKKIKCIVKNGVTFAPESYQSAMRLKGNYLYYLQGGEGTGGSIQRIKTTGGKSKKLDYVPLSDNYYSYAKKGSKIYYFKYDYDVETDTIKTPKRVMNLNGKNKAKTSKKAVLKKKNSNTKGYSVVIQLDGNYYKDYLITPKGAFYLGEAESLLL